MKNRTIDVIDASGGMKRGLSYHIHFCEDGILIARLTTSDLPATCKQTKDWLEGKPVLFGVSI